MFCSRPPRRSWPGLRSSTRPGAWPRPRRWGARPGAGGPIDVSE